MKLETKQIADGKWQVTGRLNMGREVNLSFDHEPSNDEIRQRLAESGDVSDATERADVQMDRDFALKVADHMAPELHREVMRASIWPPSVRLDVLTVTDAVVSLAAALRDAEKRAQLNEAGYPHGIAWRRDDDGKQWLLDLSRDGFEIEVAFGDDGFVDFSARRVPVSELPARRPTAPLFDSGDPDFARKADEHFSGPSTQKPGE